MNIENKEKIKIGNEIQRLRVNLDLSRKSLRNILNKKGLEKSEHWIRNLEQGKAKYTKSELNTILNILGGSVTAELSNEFTTESDLAFFLKKIAHNITSHIKSNLFLTIEVARTGTQSIKDAWLHEYLFSLLAGGHTKITIVSRKKSYLLSLSIITIKCLIDESNYSMEEAVSRLRMTLATGTPLTLPMPSQENQLWFSLLIRNLYLSQNSSIAQIQDLNPVSFYHFNSIPTSNQSPNKELAVYSFSNQNNFGTLTEEDCQSISTRYALINKEISDTASSIKELTSNEFFKKIQKKSEQYGIIWKTD